MSDFNTVLGGLLDSASLKAAKKKAYDTCVDAARIYVRAGYDAEETEAILVSTTIQAPNFQPVFTRFYLLVIRRSIKRVMKEYKNLLRREKWQTKK